VPRYQTTQLAPRPGWLFVRLEPKERHWSRILVLPEKPHNQVLDGAEGVVVAVGECAEIYDRDDDEWVYASTDVDVGDTILFSDHHEVEFPQVGPDIRPVRMNDVEAIIER